MSHIDNAAMNKLTYGLFVLTAPAGDKFNGCIINTASQVTTDPKRITIAVNKANYTHDLVLNSGTYDRVMQQIAEITADPHRGGFVSVMIHEQYFYADYRNYLSDYTDRVLDVCAFLQEKGYTGAHICDVTAERDLREHPLFQ